MMKSVRDFFSAVAIGLVFVSCANPIKDDLISYIKNELPKISKLETTVITKFNSVSGDNYTDDQTMYTMLQSEVIPTYTKFITILESIKPKTPELTTLHESYIDAANLQGAAFNIMVGALERGDSVIMSQAAEKLAQARKLIRAWQTDFQDLCKKNGIPLLENK